MPSKVKKVAKRVTARQSERYGRTVSTKQARQKAKQIIADRAPARRKATAAAVARHPNDPVSGSQARAKGRSIVKARSTPKKTGSTKRTRAVTKSAARVGARAQRKGVTLTMAEARAKARAIVKKRKHS